MEYVDSIVKNSLPQGRFKLPTISDEGVILYRLFWELQGRKYILDRFESQHILSKLLWTKWNYRRIHSTVFVED